jgi:hypothetical protein
VHCGARRQQPRQVLGSVLGMAGPQRGPGRALSQLGAAPGGRQGGLARSPVHRDCWKAAELSTRGVAPSRLPTSAAMLL